MRPVLYLTVDQILEIHNAEVGPVGYDLGVVASAVGRPQQSAFGADAFPTIHLKAAALLHGLACTQGFTDGNKRVAAIAVRLFYGLNGFKFDLEQGELYDLVLNVAQKDFDNNLEKLAEILEKYASTGDPPA